MVPIYEQGHGKGIGYGLDSFLERFDAICREHVEGKRAKAFAFIFYDFQDQALRRILKDQGVFAQLDRLAGASLSIFYLNTTARRETVMQFNNNFLSKLHVEDATPPCVVFFRLEPNGISEIAVAQLDSADLLHGLHELYTIIQRYVEADANNAGDGLRSLKWLKAGGRLVAVEAFREVLKKGLDLLIR